MNWKMILKTLSIIMAIIIIAFTTSFVVIFAPTIGSTVTLIFLIGGVLGTLFFFFLSAGIGEIYDRLESIEKSQKKIIEDNEKAIGTAFDKVIPAEEA